MNKPWQTPQENNCDNRREKAFISDKKELQSAGAEGSLLEALLDNLLNLTWIVNEEEKLVFANNSFYRYFKLNKNEAVGRLMVDLVPEYISKALYPKHKDVFKNGKPIEVVEKVKWANGINFVFLINIFPVNNKTGEKLVGGQAINLEDKYASDKQLQEAHDRLLLLSRATTDAIWEWDMQTGKIFRNDALMDIIGYSQEETKGLSWWLRRIHPEDRNRISDKVKETTDKRQHSWQDRYRFKCADGNYKYMQDKGFVVYENGLPVKMIGSLQDITDLKALEEQLVEEKLQKQKEISETVIRVQERERTRIGHELHDNVNQLLSTVRLFVGMLTPANNDEKEIKTKSLEYVGLAIEEIRKLSKELVTPHLVRNGLVNSIRTLVDDIAMAKAIRIDFTYDKEKYPLTPGKELTLFRITQEQVKNILKYSSASQANIHLSCTENCMQLLIEDNGVGFDSGQTRQGIGLSNIYERTRFYNGSVNIDTKPGKGCKLSISMPLL